MEPGRKTNKRSRLIDLLVLLLCVFCAGFFLFRFWLDFNQRLSKGNEQAVGTITYKRKAAQRRFMDRVLWDRLQRESPVYNGDLVRTADISEATVTFNSGHVIALEENSLIQIFADENGPRVDFVQGAVSLDASQSSNGVVLTSGGRVINVSGGGAVKIGGGGDGGGDFQMSVEAGTAQITGEDGTVEQIAQGAGLFLNADGTISAEPRVVVYEPKSSEKLVSAAAETPIGFSWNTTNYYAGLSTRIELSADRTFRTITQVREYDTAGHAELRVPAGTTYWRVYPVAQRTAAGANPGDYTESAATGRLTIVHSLAPRLISPAVGEVIMYRNALPAVRFQWTSDEDAALFRLIIANNATLTSPAITVNARTASQVVSTLGAGTWYWRVEPVFAADTAGNGDPSAIGSFVIRQNQAEMDPPKLVSPPAEGVISIAAGAPDSVFTWKGDREAAGFTVIIARDSALEQPLVNTRTTNNYWTYHQAAGTFGTGRYFWAVSQHDAAGQTAALSEIRSFQANPDVTASDLKPLPVPVAVFPPRDGRIPLPARPLDFTWRPVSGAQRYRLKLYHANDTTNALYETVTAGVQTAAVPLTGEGAFVWTVQALGTAGTSNLERSGAVEPVPFNVRRVSPVNLVSPAAGAAISGLSALRTPGTVVWTSSEPLRSSRLVLTRRGGNTVLDVANPVSPVRLPRLAEGSYEWTVYAETADGYPASAPAPISFAVTAAVPPLIALVSPPNGAAVSITEVETAGLLQWESAEEPARSRFVLSTNPDPLSGTPLLDIQNPERRLTLPWLDAGDYYWTVTGTTADNLSISARAPSRLSVVPAPPLPAVAYLAPRDGAELVPEDVRLSRRLTFIWGAVDGANEYVFTLRKATGETLLSLPPIMATSWVLDDLGILTEGGTYIWQVTAQQRIESGRLLRTGLLSESRFTFMFERPSRQQADPPGLMYGRNP